jgi:site-specific DNA-cytosine methylase
MIEYLSHIPLIGGFTLAAMNITQKPPVALTSFKSFHENDSILSEHLERKGHNVPYYLLDEDTKPLFKFKEIPLVTGVPPCSGLSLSSNLKPGARQNSPVNEWMVKSVDLMTSIVKPQVYVFENAPGLFTSVGEVARSRIDEITKKNGYAVTYYKTDTLFHGIPQRRPRTFCFVVKGNKAPIIPEIHRPAPTVAEYLRDIPDDASHMDEFTINEPYINDYEIVKYLKERIGENWREEILSVREHLSSYEYLERKDTLGDFKEWLERDPEKHERVLRDVNHIIRKRSMGMNYRIAHKLLLLDKRFIYAVIGENMERNVHPTEDRRMSIREYMHLMGMPHDFVLRDPERMWQKIPQNVPVKTSEDMVKEALNIIKGDSEYSGERVCFINNTKKKEKIKTKRLF